MASMAERCQRISNLFLAYHNSGKSADVFGREFFHAVGDVLNGTPLGQLEVFHIDAHKIAEVVLVNNGRMTAPKKGRGKHR